MTTKIKSTLLTGLFFFGLLTGLQAQDKYEFATITQASINELRISIEGKPFEIQKLKGVAYAADHDKLYEYVSKMQTEGWEVFSVISGEGVTTAFVLRRKK